MCRHATKKINTNGKTLKKVKYRKKLVLEKVLKFLFIR